MNQKNLRNSIYWFIDKLKGGKIKHHLSEVDFILNNLASEPAIKIREKNLANLLNHAVQTTHYYERFKNYNSIQDFPIINKIVIQGNFKKFQSKPFVDLDNFKVSTSGSTGVPFFLFQNKNKRYRNRADVIYFLNKCGYNIGDKLFELEVWRKHNQKGKLTSWLQNVIQFDISRLTDERIEELLNSLAKDNSSRKTILGFASSFEVISQYLENKNLKLDIKNLSSAVANSEYLTPYTKETMGKYLNTNILSRYSSEEIGIVAHQTLNLPNSFMVNHASYSVEVLNFDNDNPVKEGEHGRIVVTDLFNYAMPIIRYDTGDIAKLNTSSEGIPYFEKVEGRKMDLIYDTKGNIISSFVIYTKFYKYYNLLRQYQFIQKDKDKYEIKLNLKDDKFEFEEKLITDFIKDFGDDAQVTITYVDEIPPLSSGKRRKVVNLYNP